MIAYFLEVFFTLYAFLLLIRIFGSWFPQFSNSRFMQYVGFYTDPYLNLFKKVIPPLGMLDLSPMVAFLILQMARHFLMALLH